MKNLACLIFCLLLALANLATQANGETSGMEKINIGKQLA